MALSDIANNFKAAVQASVKTAKFNGVSVHCNLAPDKSLDVSIEARANVDLPGDLDVIVANAAKMLGLGNSPAPSPSSES
jgi:hypothetical protein